MSAVEEDDTVDNVLERATSSNASETASTTETSLVDDAANDDLLSDADTRLMEHEDHGETHDEYVSRRPVTAVPTQCPPRTAAPAATAVAAPSCPRPPQQPAAYRARRRLAAPSQRQPAYQ